MAKTWVKPTESAWIRPTTPTISTGILVIESDDGNAGDYTHWFPLVSGISREFSSWTPPRAAVVSEALNPGTVGKPNRVTWDQVKHMRRMGWDTVSHGEVHAGLGRFSVLSDVAPGATTVNIEGANQVGTFEGYDYVITDGEKSETFEIESVAGTYESGTITLQSPLTNGYRASDSYIQLTDESAASLLQGAIDSFEEQGISCKHHSYAYHSGTAHFLNPDALVWVGQHFASGRGRTTTPHNVSGNYDIRALNCGIIVSDRDELDEILDFCSENDTIVIMYGHGEKTESALDDLEYLVRGALDRGIRITTRSRAVTELLKREHSSDR